MKRFNICMLALFVSSLIFNLLGLREVDMLNGHFSGIYGTVVYTVGLRALCDPALYIVILWFVKTFVSIAGTGEKVQLVQSELDWQGYPDITVRAGVPVRWVIHADEEKITGCNNEMVIPALDLRVSLSPGDNIVEFTVNEPGIIPYTCWMGMLNGSITVVEAE